MDEAVALLKEGQGRAVVLAGGTSLTVRPPPSVTTLVDLSRLGLTGVEDDGSTYTIKACTTLADLAESPLMQKAYGGVVADAAGRVAATPLRNLITAGGNAVQVLPWSDLPAVFLALGAEFQVKGDKERTIPAADFYASHPRKSLAPHDIVTGIRITKPVGRATGAFAKVAKTAFDYAALGVTAVCWFSGDQVRDCAVTLGAVRPLPTRVPQAEEEIVDRVPTREDVVRAAGRAAGAIDPSQDYRYSKEYRGQLIKVWVKRCLLDALDLGKRG